MCSKNFVLLLSLAAVLSSSCGKISPTLEGKLKNSTSNVAYLSTVDSVIADNANFSAPDLKIVRNATLRIQVDSLDKVRNEVRSLLKSKGGFIANESQEQTGSNSENSLVIKIPQSNFEEFVQVLCKSGKYVSEKDISSEDVSMQYIDLQARLNSKKELESRYINLLKNSSKIEDLIKLEDKLSNVRSDIENLEGQFRFLNNQITYCTINVVFYELVMPSSTSGLNYLSKAWLSLKNGWNFLLDGSLLLLKIWPVLFLLYLFYYINNKYKFIKT